MISDVQMQHHHTTGPQDAAQDFKGKSELEDTGNKTYMLVKHCP